MQERRHGKAGSGGPIRNGACRSDVEPEPVADIASRGRTEVRLGNLLGDRPKDIDVDRGPHTQVASEECGSAFDDPIVVDQIKTFE